MKKNGSIRKDVTLENIKILKRKRINHILSTVYNYSLTIIEAPMGFGKTTAVKEFLQSEKIHIFGLHF